MSKNLYISNKYIDNESNKLFRIDISNFEGVNKYKIYTDSSINNGYISLNIKTTYNVSVIYDGVKLYETSENKVITIPCIFKDNSILEINGKCDNVNILIYGAKIYNNKNDIFLPLNKKILKYRNNNYCVCDFDSLEDILNKKLICSKVIDNLLCAQSFKINNIIYWGYLFKNNGVYFCTNMNNYSQNILIVDDCDYAQIVPMLDNLYVFYVKENKVYYKIIDNNLKVSVENEFVICYDGKIEGFLDMVLYEFVYGIFTIKISNNIYFYIYENGKFICKIVRNNNNCIVYIDNNNVSFVGIVENVLTISTYALNNNNYLPIKNSNLLYNVDYFIKYNNRYLIEYNNFFTEKSYDELFGNKK